MIGEKMGLLGRILCSTIFQNRAGELEFAFHFTGADTRKEKNPQAKARDILRLNFTFCKQKQNSKMLFMQSVIF
jgi:hypothetical protein